jgi:DNA-binding response OmpR family regulator
LGARPRQVEREAKMTEVRASCGPILVAEDDAGVAELLAATFDGAGYDVLLVASGREAVAAARREAPAAAVLDVQLPDLSGYEVCRALRADFGDELPILFLSGHRTDACDRVAGLLLGADDYVVKPFAPDELLARVRVLLRRVATSSPRPVRRHPELTRRETEILQLLAHGLDQAEIARRLVISPKTVGTHIERILGKLAVRSRAQAVAVAYRDALVA